MGTSCAKSTSSLLGVAAETQLKMQLRDQLQKQREQNSAELAFVQQLQQNRSATPELTLCDQPSPSRIENANRKRQALVVDHLLAKLGSMRGPLHPHMLPPDLEAFSEPGLHGTALKAKPKAPVPSSCPLGSSGFSSGSKGGIGGLGSGPSDTTGPESHGKARRKADAGPKVTPEMLALRKRAQRRLRVFKGVVRTFLCYLAHKKRTTSVARIKVFLQQTGEWARVRSAARSLIAHIKTTQRKCRECLASKRKRCDDLSKVWERVETHFLSEYFRKFTKNVLEESSAACHDLQATGITRSRSKKQMANTALMATALEHAGVDAEEAAADMIDWNALRIPKEDRRERIGRHYMHRLRQYVRDQKAMLEAAQRAVQHQKDINIIYKEFACDEAAVVKGVLCSQDLGKSIHPRFWDLTEKATLDLIGCAAYARRDQPPYHLHPANMDGSAEDATERAAEAHAALLKGLRSVSHVRKPADEASAAAVSPVSRRMEIKVDSMLDVEDVWDKFTPRLREMQKVADNAPAEEGDDGTHRHVHGEGVYVPTPDARHVDVARHAL